MYPPYLRRLDSTRPIIDVIGSEPVCRRRTIVPRMNSWLIDAMTNVQDPLYQEILGHLPAGAKASEFITSLAVTARKTAPCCGSRHSGQSSSSIFESLL